MSPKCEHCSAITKQYPCDYCNQDASPELKRQMTERRSEYLSKMITQPSNCVMYEEIIENAFNTESCAFSTVQETVTFMHQMNAIHSSHSNPGVHRH